MNAASVVSRLEQLVRDFVPDGADGKSDVWSARLCLGDAEQLLAGKQYHLARSRALRGLAYLVGVHHPDYIACAGQGFMPLRNVLLNELRYRAPNLVNEVDYVIDVVDELSTALKALVEYHAGLNFGGECDFCGEKPCAEDCLVDVARDALKRVQEAL